MNIHEETHLIFRNGNLIFPPEESGPATFRPGVIRFLMNLYSKWDLFFKVSPLRFFYLLLIATIAMLLAVYSDYQSVHGKATGPPKRESTVSSPIR